MNANRLDLFSSLYRWVDKHHENYLSESLAFIIGHMLETSPELASSFISFITGGRESIEADEARLGKVTAQKHSEIHGIPDIWLDLPGLDIAIEVKIDAPAYSGQLEAYRNELDASEKSRTCLVFLSKYISSSSTDAADNSIRWFQIADWLLQNVSSDNVDPSMNYLASEFIQHLRRRKLAFVPVRSPLSRAVKDHMQGDPDEYFLSRRVRSLDVISESEALAPLRNLLSLMRAAIDLAEIDERPMLDSGQDPSPWIGYNLQGMRFFFYIYLTDPDSLLFETSYRFEMEPPKVGSLRIGEFVEKSGGIDAWINSYDLAASSEDFFLSPSDQQVRVLRSFLEESYAKAMTLEASA